MNDEQYGEIELKVESNTEYENKFIKKNFYYFNNACTQYKFSFVSTENKTKSYINWYENLDKTSKVRLNRNSNLVIFGLAESEATKKSERENHDVDLFAKLIGEIEILNLLTTNAKIMFQIEDTKRLNPKKKR